MAKNKDTQESPLFKKDKEVQESMGSVDAAYRNPNSVDQILARLDRLESLNSALEEENRQLKTAQGGVVLQKKAPINLSVIRTNHLKPFKPSKPGNRIRYANVDFLEEWRQKGWNVCETESGIASRYKDLVPIETSPDNPLLLQEEETMRQLASVHEAPVERAARKKTVMPGGIIGHTEYDRVRGDTPSNKGG